MISEIKATIAANPSDWRMNVAANVVSTIIVIAVIAVLILAVRPTSNAVVDTIVEAS